MSTTNNAELLLKLPLLTDWIDSLLAANARQARPVSSFGFRRLLNFYPSDLLSKARVVVVERVPVPPLTALGLQQFAAFEQGDYGGITFKDTYFVKADESSRESLHFHELVHVVQWAHLGVEKFLLAYAEGLAANGYRNSPLEMMAYNLQDYFERDGQPGDVVGPVINKLTELYS